MWKDVEKNMNCVFWKPFSCRPEQEWVIHADVD